jgi:hypothetical protein
MANELTGLARRLLNNLRTYAGTLTSSGTLGKLRNLLRTYSGALSFIGTVTNSVATVAQEYIRDYSSILYTSGDIILIEVQRYLQNQLTQILSSSGSASRLLLVFRNYASSVSFSGTVNKGFDRIKDGALSFSGYVNKAIVKTKDGSLSFSGAYSRLLNNIARTRDGVIDFAGVVTSSIWTAAGYANDLSSNLYISGDIILIQITRYLQNQLSQVLSSSGAASRLLSIKRNYTSSISFSSLLNKALLKTKSGVLTISGAISYATSVSQRFFAEGRTGTQSFIGSVSRSLSLSRYTRGYLPPEGKWDTSGILDFLGSVVASNKILTKTKDGVLSFAGTVTNLYTGGLVRTYEGAVNFGGVIAFIEIYLKGKLTDAVISFSGTVAGVIFVTQRYTSIGTMQTPVGVVTRLFKITKTYLGTLSLDGAISHLTSKFKDYAGSLSLNSVLEYVKSGGVAAISVLEDGILSLTGTSSRTIAIQKSYGGGPTFQSSYVRNGAFFRTLYSGVAPYAPDMGGGGGMTGGEFYMDLSMGV